jgi:hypothetical protein
MYIELVREVEGKGGSLMKEQHKAAVYRCQRKGCNNDADYKLVHKRYDTLIQYICNEHLNDDLGNLMRKEYIPIKITDE